MKNGEKVQTEISKEKESAVLAQFNPEDSKTDINLNTIQIYDASTEDLAANIEVHSKLETDETLDKKTSRDAFVARESTGNFDGTNDLGTNSVDEPEENSIDDLAAPKDAIIVETKSCEMKDLVIEAKDNVLTKDHLAECLERF